MKPGKKVSCSQRVLVLLAGFAAQRALICQYTIFTSYFSGQTSCVEAIYFLFLFCILSLLSISKEREMTGENQ